MAQMEDSHCSRSAREIYEGWCTSGSTGFTESCGDSGPVCSLKPSFSCQEIYEGRQRAPDNSLVSRDSGGCDASRKHLSAQRPKGILGTLICGCFKSGKIGTVNGENSCSNETANAGGCTHRMGFRLTASEVYRATRNFSPSHKIGEGSSGSVYRGILNDGTFVAVKRGKAMHDGQLSLEFQSKVQTLARIKHVNLVEILGYLHSEDERISVLEYVPNGTLREHLDGLYGTTLDLVARLDIARDVADALTYLHKYLGHPVIHRDIKSSSILITENIRAKVDYIGSACLAETDTGATQISTNISGISGYLDPEYLKSYQLTEKTDVYSFGVLLVELVSGRRLLELKKPSEEKLTIRWAAGKFEAGDAVSVLDPNLSRNPASNLALIKILALALHCLAPRRKSRPSMYKCSNTIRSIRKEYKEAVDVKHHKEYSQRLHGSMDGWP